jgi:hypothetical protein
MERCKTTLASFNGKIYHEHLKIIIYYLHAYDVNIIFYLTMHVQDGYELRKQILAQLLTYKENECEHYRKRALRQQLSAVGEDSNPVGEGFPNRVSELLLAKNRWCFK